MQNPERTTKTVIDIAIKLMLLAVMVIWCFQIMNPFFAPIFWGIVIAISVKGIYAYILRRTRGSRKLASVIYVLIFLVLLILPTAFLAEEMISDIAAFGKGMSDGTLAVPPPNEDVKDWPVIGKPLFDTWNLAATNLEGLARSYEPQLKTLGTKILESLLGFGGLMLLLTASIIISGVILAYQEDGQSFFKSLFRRAIGTKGDEFVDLGSATVKSVTKGILGVAVIQTTVIAIGLVLADVPHAGLWSLLILILAITQLPASLVTIPIIVYLFTALSPLPAILWSVYLAVAGLIDNVLKPILLGKGADVPMLVIFMGSIGGFAAFGFMGLFFGAIVLSIAYKILNAWMAEDAKQDA